MSSSIKNKMAIVTIPVRCIKLEQSTLNMSEDEIMNQVLAAHARTDVEIDVKTIFGAADNIITNATNIVDNIASGTNEQLDNPAKDQKSIQFQAGFSAPSSILEDISREMGCKALHGEDAHKATLSVLSMLSSYSWDAKAALAIAAFAVQYGEFWLLTQNPSDQLVMSVAILKKIPAILNPSKNLKTALVSLNNLVKTLLDISRSIVLIEKLSIKHTIKDVPSLSSVMSRIPIYVYWTIMAVVYCASQIHVLTALGEEYQAPELIGFFHMFTAIHSTLQNKLDDINQQIESNRAYQGILKLHAHPTDNVEIIKALICAKDDAQPLVHGATKQVTKIEDLRKKNVLLHISSVNISQEEIDTLKNIYLDSGKDRQFEILWIPIEDQWTDETQKIFQSHGSKLPWYTVQRPSLIYETPNGRAAAKFIKDEWNFKNDTTIVSLDPQGKVQCPNAYHMIRIWGTKAFPFDSSMEETLWKQESWSTELLLDGIHPEFPTWIKEGKYIFLYGGTDVKWLKDFEESLKPVAKEAKLPAVMLHVGRGGSVKQDREQKSINAFWDRLESLWFSKIQQIQSHSEQDVIMQEIQKLVKNQKDGCWAVVCRGSNVLINDHGSVLLSAFIQFDVWKNNLENKGFDDSLLECVDTINRGNDEGHKCRHFYFPIKAGKIPEYMNCPDCPRDMEKFITFQCCHNDNDKTIC